MLCRNCGAQVENGATHCTNCGAPLEAAPAYSAPSGGSFQDGLKKLTSGPMDQSKIMFFVSGAAMILMMIFQFIPSWYSMKVSAYGYTETFNYISMPFGAIGKDINGGQALWILVSIVILILALAFIACGLYYIYKKIKGDADAKKIGMLAVCIAAVIFAISLITAIIGAIAIPAHVKAQINQLMGDMGNMVKYSFFFGFSAYAYLVLGAVAAYGVIKS